MRFVLTLSKLVFLQLRFLRSEDVLLQLPAAEAINYFQCPLLTFHFVVSARPPELLDFLAQQSFQVLHGIFFLSFFVVHVQLSLLLHLKMQANRQSSTSSCHSESEAFQVIGFHFSFSE